MKEQDLIEKLFQSFYKELKEDAGFYDEETAKVCVQIAKDYAEQEAIEFASFLRRHCQADNNFLYWWYAGEKYNEKQLYQLFKNRENEQK